MSRLAHYAAPAVHHGSSHAFLDLISLVAFVSLLIGDKMAAKKDFVPVAFDLIGSEAGALLFVDLKKDWAPVVNSDAIKYELKAASGVVRPPLLPPHDIAS
jgi:hypothetical protein